MFVLWPFTTVSTLGFACLMTFYHLLLIVSTFMIWWPLPIHSLQGIDNAHRYRTGQLLCTHIRVCMCVFAESQVKLLMPYWYKPRITREEAIALVLPMATGSFIVRDSSTVKGGYALTLKITEAIVRQRKKLSAGEQTYHQLIVPPSPPDQTHNCKQIYTQVHVLTSAESIPPKASS